MLSLSLKKAEFLDIFILEISVELSMKLFYNLGVRFITVSQAFNILCILKQLVFVLEFRISSMKFYNLLKTPSIMYRSEQI